MITFMIRYQKMHGAPPLSSQKSCLFSAPLMQQAVLSRPAALPAEAHPAPPHWPHLRGQQAVMRTEVAAAAVRRVKRRGDSVVDVA